VRCFSATNALCVSQHSFVSPLSFPSLNNNEKEKNIYLYMRETVYLFLSFSCVWSPENRRIIVPSHHVPLPLCEEVVQAD